MGGGREKRDKKKQNTAINQNRAHIKRRCCKMVKKRKANPKDNGKWHVGVPSAQHHRRDGEGVSKRLGNLAIKKKMDGNMLKLIGMNS